MKNLSIVIGILLLLSCTKTEELSLAELDEQGVIGLKELLAKTVSKPWKGEEFKPGKLGGQWKSVISEDPKSFNMLIAEQDGATSAVVGTMHDYFLDYDVVERKWVPHAASFEIIVDEKNDNLRIVYTLRDDLYWSYYNSNKKIKVTSDDVIFWYDEICGKSEFGSSGYYGQFMTMPDGTDAHIDIKKIDERRFYFNFPRIVAEPELQTNMDFGAKHIYEPAKKAGGVEGVKNVFNVSVDPKIMPSMGEWFLVEYTPGQRLVYKRNPDYWRKDTKGLSTPFTEETVVRIIPDENTKLLLFKNGDTESYSLRPEDLDGLVNNNDGSYTVFNNEGSLNAAFWSFNQNPINKDKPHYEWFTQKEFRQAMSCFLNRDRLNAQVYRGLAQPKINIFPEPNQYYNPEIKLQYLYDTKKGIALLSSIGIKKDSMGIMRDNKNRPIKFDLVIRSEGSIYQDTASIIMDELSKIGIKINIRVIDFQKQVEMVFKTYDWESTLMAFNSSNIFPSQGSNSWPSSGNYHIWYPNQEKPATDWEARIDLLYNEGKFTIDTDRAKIIWDEFQSIILEQCPMIYMMRSRGFWALNNRWDFSNVYFDNLNGAETSFVFLK